MSRLDKAKEVLFEEEALTFAAVGADDEVYSSQKKGIAPIMEILWENPEILRGAAVADKVIGKAAALLLIKGRVATLYAKVISKHAYAVLMNSAVQISYDNQVAFIINRNNTGMCPMEEAVLGIDDADAAYELLQIRLAELAMRK